MSAPPPDGQPPDGRPLDGPPPGGSPPAKAPRRLSPLTPLVRAPIVLVAVVGGSWQQLLSGDSLGLTGLLLLALLVGGGGYGVASWLLTRYWVDGDELRIDTGVVFRQSRRIRIDRLQGVDILQPLVARLVGLAELRFDVASGSDREGTLAFLPHTEALELRRLLLERRDRIRGGTEPDGPAPAPGGPPPEQGPWREPVPGGAPSAERPLARLDLGRLLLSLALSTEMLWVLAGAVGLGVGYLLTGSFAVAGGILPALLAVAISLGRKLTSYYGFTLSESPAGYHVRRGLTALSSQTIAPARIQGLVLSEPLLWRPLGWARLEVAVAGYESADPDRAQASSTLMPVAPVEEVRRLLRHVLEGRDVEAVRMVRPPRRARWLAPLTAWNLSLGQHRELLVSRRGWWVRRLDVVPQERLQSLRVTQGPLQRRLRLGDVHVDSPPGPVRVRGAQRDPAEARGYLREAVELSRAARRRVATPPLPESSGQGGAPPTTDTTQ